MVFITRLTNSLWSVLYTFCTMPAVYFPAVWGLYFLLKSYKVHAAMSFWTLVIFKKEKKSLKIVSATDRSERLDVFHSNTRCLETCTIQKLNISRFKWRTVEPAVLYSVTKPQRGNKRPHVVRWFKYSIHMKPFNKWNWQAAAAAAAAGEQVP